MKNFNVKMPPEILEIANQISFGQILPLNMGITPEGKVQNYTSFLIKEEDKNLEQIGYNPIVEVNSGVVKIYNQFFNKEIYLLLLLIRFNKNNNIIYETSFSFTNEAVWSDFQNLFQQNSLQYLICGQKYNTVVISQIDGYFKALLTTLEKYLQNNVKNTWTDKEYIATKNIINNLSLTKLWTALSEENILSLKDVEAKK